jgi:D-alanyl-lipoteichoic acid acyltransferase DltB (MBOAT superfamily)
MQPSGHSDGAPTERYSAQDSKPTSWPEGAGTFLSVVLQLVLVLALVHLYDIEQLRGLPKLSGLVLVGFLLHSWLPLRMRPTCFLGISLLGYGLIFEPAQAAALLAIGLGLIGVCHLPIAWGARITILLASGAVLTAMRASWIMAPWAESLLPILGSMFMFRLVLYVYDLRTEARQASLPERISYFFLLPNALFPLFPIVDFRTYRRTYYDGPANEIYHKGVRWMGRGVLHLLLYRLIYQNFTPAAAEVHDLGTLILSMVSGYALYLRVSGLFHLIIGMLCLFGFNLPETHHHYFLASGFNDLWRRINIYWKDFMMKIVYYPIFIRLRRTSPNRAMVVATVSVFMISWWLHSYQLFWARGTFPLTVIDAIFWTIFAVTVLANSMLQARRGRGRPSAARTVGVREATLHSLKVVGMFSFMCALWSFWTSDTIDAWTSMLAAASQGPGVQYAWLGAGLVGAVAAGAAYQVLVQGAWEGFWQRAGTGGTSLANVAVLLPLLILGLPALEERTQDTLLATVRTERLNDEDQARLTRGYYEEVLEGERKMGMLAEVKSKRPPNWPRIEETTAKISSPYPVLVTELAPNLALDFCESILGTNEWGMRDRSYPKAKPPGTHRIAFLGASVVMGSGVENHEVFDELIEARLGEANQGLSFERYEVLNFAESGYSIIQQQVVLEEKVSQFDVDTAIYFAHTIDERVVLQHVKRMKRFDVEVPYPALRTLLEDYDEDPGRYTSSAERQWELEKEILSWGYRRFAEQCKARGIRPVWCYLQHPQRVSRAMRARGEEIIELGRGSGCITLILDGLRIYPRKRADELRLRPWDSHPNPEGHQRIADVFYEALLENEDPLGLGLPQALPQNRDH